MLVLTALGCGQTTREPPGGGAEAGGAGLGGSAAGGGGSSDVGPCEPSRAVGRGPQDPAVAGTQYGPLMGGSVTAGERVMSSTGTAAAVAVTHGSHLFYTTQPTDELPDVYISIVVPDPAWSPGVYTEPLAGAIEVTTHDDCRYYLDLAQLGSDASFRLEVSESQPQGSDFYLKGRLDAELPSRNGRSPIALHFTIN